jgi:hypothetical protein
MKQGAYQNLKWIASITIIALFSAGFYLWSSQRIYGFGYPLDDAWIHQTYARNLIEAREWSFIPGTPSAGSTSPLWTFILAFSPLLDLDHRVWTYFMGILLLVLLGWMCAKWFSIRRGLSSPWGWMIGAVIVLEWHLVWASVSGMETLVFASLCVAVLWLLEQQRLRPFLVGLLIGLGVWLRPGAVTLVFPAFMVLLIVKQSARLKALLIMIGGIILVVCPYLLFNNFLTGSIWPNTFYAKQAEYAILNESPLLLRFMQQLLQPLIGAGILLLPGIVLSVLHNLRERRLSRLAALLWALIYLGMYALRLPVTYQHGRYAIPTIPVIFIVGLEGVVGWVRLQSPTLKERFLSRLWVATTLAVLIAFVFIGGKAYAQDVAIIESEMVTAAKWIAENTEEDALIAAHDIGALGYFADRDLLDLAGLVSPEVIPIIRDEDALATYLNDQGADYLMTFPNWYPQLVRGLQALYITEGEFSPNAGGENMVVYQWGY